MTLRILLIAEHASSRFGGEAALPLHYYRVLRQRGAPVWMITHARVREELAAAYPEDIDTRIVFIRDSVVHKALWKLGRWLPRRVAYSTTGLLSRLVTQLLQRRVARRMVAEHRVDAVHQPIPVSPLDPSLLFGLGAPIFIGPMNGGMNYPAHFRGEASRMSGAAVALGRAVAELANIALPGKRLARALFVANERTAQALPFFASRQVHQVVENGVDLALWNAPGRVGTTRADGITRFAFLGRLVDWKCVDVAIEALAVARQLQPMSLTVIGDGVERERLTRRAAALGIADGLVGTPGGICFAGWLDQKQAADALADHDCLLLPSIFECGGAVVLEAMALGLPVIATDWGGPADYIDASCGYLVRPDSRAQLVDGFAKAMVEIAMDPARRQSLGNAGRRRVETLYDWEKKVDAVLGLMKDSLAPGAAP